MKVLLTPPRSHQNTVSSVFLFLFLQESVTGSTLNGRKEYLKADEGDKDKYEFLNFASAWTPGEMVLPAENAGNAKDELFFTHVSREEENYRTKKKKSVRP